jgi:hypothetical protein
MPSECVRVWHAHGAYNGDTQVTDRIMSSASLTHNSPWLCNMSHVKWHLRNPCDGSVSLAIGYKPPANALSIFHLIIWSLRNVTKTVLLRCMVRNGLEHDYGTMPFWPRHTGAQLMQQCSIVPQGAARAAPSKKCGTTSLLRFEDVR